MIRKLLAMVAALAALVACDPMTGTSRNGHDPYTPTITAMKHQPEVKGHWGKITYVRSRECWAIWYHSPYTNDVVKHCALHSTYRKYRVGMAYHG